jgi:ubiquinone/menaquinone biosynthesis C-methylase UbiE
MERYVIRGGREGYDRLLLLARNRWPDTSALFQRAGIRVGARCIDLGCGGGEVTIELAQLVGPQGSVTGIDMDAVKLGLARAEAARRGAVSAEFRALNVNDWDEPATYDVVYSRFLLQHLRHPAELIRRMWSAVRAEGVILVEDADFDGWCCDPPNNAFEFFVRAYSEAIHRSGGDHSCGRKLLAYFREAGIPNPEVAVVQPVYVEGEAKWLPWSTLEASAETIVSVGAASAAEVRAALAGLDQFTRDPETLISGPRIFQLRAYRSA